MGNNATSSLGTPFTECLVPKYLSRLNIEIFLDLRVNGLSTLEILSSHWRSTFFNLWACGLLIENLIFVPFHLPTTFDTDVRLSP